MGSCRVAQGTMSNQNMMEDSIQKKNVHICIAGLLRYTTEIEGTL